MKKIIIFILLIILSINIYSEKTKVYKIVENKLILVGYIDEKGIFVSIKK
jgi:hypothetical protein